MIQLRARTHGQAAEVSSMIIGIVLPSVQLPPTASTRSLQGLLHDIDDTDVERFDKQYSSTVRRNFGLWTVIPLAVIRLVLI